MAHCFSASTADGIWRKAAKRLLRDDGWREQASRCGNTRELLHVTFEITNPRQRWISSRLPGLSPAFAIAEVFWILAGREDAGFLNFWNPSLPKFAGTDAKYYGAYGYRIRAAHGLDQLDIAYRALESNPSTRQVVIQIWSPELDLPAPSGAPRASDIPCNVCSMLKIRDGALEWTQIMRSNDLIRGTPYNIIQFSTLQEIMAGWLGVRVGTYFQVSDSLHVYESDLERFTVSREVAGARNTDDLALPKAESETVIETSLAALEQLTAPDLRPRDIARLTGRNLGLPTGYVNLLAIAAADSARRRGWPDEAALAISACKNKTLLHAWQCWVESRRAVL